MGTTRVPVGLGLLREWMHLPPTVRVVNVEPGPDFYWFRVVCEGDDVPDAPEAKPHHDPPLRWATRCCSPRSGTRKARRRHDRR